VSAAAPSGVRPDGAGAIWNREAETMPREARERLQLERLQAVVRWAVARVPFHRARLGAAEPRALGDLAGLPFVRKTDLREQYPFGLLAVPRDQLARVHASSGTKGKPTVVAYTAEDLDVWREAMARTMTAAGARRGDLLHIAFGYGLFTGGLGFHDGAERIGMTVVPVSSGNTARHQLLLQDFRPDAIAATPSFALHLAETLAEQGSAPRELGLRYGMFGAEPWTEGIRAALERAFGLQAFDIYGLSEIIGPGVAGECEARAGLHIADDHFLPEIVDPASGSPLSPGREGELVLTTLTKRAMPLVRYRTGDITTLTLEPCACGRTSARMARIKGRADDMLIVRGVNLFPSEVESTLLGVEELVPHYQLVVDRGTTLARLEVQVEPSPELVARCGGFSAEHPEIVTLRRRAAEQLQRAIGLSVELTIVAPRTIPRAEGKAVRVIERG
jgi:phenylacetate-CoA ligase